jgi:predicted TIM-barrel fold metal-dependent hydrolase
MKTICLRLLLLTFVSSIAVPAFCQDAGEIKMKDYHPVSIYHTVQTTVEKAKYPVIDLHSHNYPKSDAGVDQWVKIMDATGIAKTIILSGSTGPGFDSVVTKYGRYKDRFEVWCGFDYTGYNKPGWQKHAVAELERCYQKGARGVGELGDKGLGELYSHPVPGYGMHIDDPRMKPLLEKCAELHMPISIHIAEDRWMYLPADSTNDGLMNAAKWHVDLSKKGILDHDQLIATLEHAVKENPKTTFIACHLANSTDNLAVLGKLLDTYPNLYADIAARYGEFSPVPRYTRAFMEKYADRLVYGTDMGDSPDMYRITFRILETEDEHFYSQKNFNYHWALYGLGLPDDLLKKIYHDNSQKILGH